jgi:hypothetical protein
MDNQQQFLTMVGQGARLDAPGAHRATAATLDTLWISSPFCG